MRYNVEGADTVSGADRVITVEADDERAAEMLAQREGLLVSAVFEAQTLSAAEELDLMVGEAMANPAPPPPAPLMYRSAGQMSVSIPSYAGLKTASWVLMIFSMIAYAIGGLALIISVFSLIGGAFYRPSLAAAALTLMASIWPIFLGAIMHAMSSACMALRDIARNSFR